MLIRGTERKVWRKDGVVQVPEVGSIHEGTYLTLLLWVALAFSLISTSPDVCFRYRT